MSTPTTPSSAAAITPNTLSNHFPDAIPITLGSLLIYPRPMYQQHVSAKFLVYVDAHAFCHEINVSDSGSLSDWFKPNMPVLMGKRNTVVLFSGTIGAIQQKQMDQIAHVVVYENVKLYDHTNPTTTTLFDQESVLSLLWGHFVAAQQYFFAQHLLLNPNQGRASVHYRLLPQDHLTRTSDWNINCSLVVVAEVKPPTMDGDGKITAYVFDPDSIWTSSPSVTTRQHGHSSTTTTEPPVLSSENFKSTSTLVWSTNRSGIPFLPPKGSVCILLTSALNRYVSYYPIFGPYDLLEYSQHGGDKDAVLSQNKTPFDVTMLDNNNNQTQQKQKQQYQPQQTPLVLFPAQNKIIFEQLFAFHHQQALQAATYTSLQTAFIHEYDQYNTQIKTQLAEKECLRLAKEKREQQRAENERQHMLRLVKVLPLAENYISDFITMPKMMIMKHIALLSQHDQDQEQYYPSNKKNENLIIPTHFLEEITTTLEEYEQDLLYLLNTSLQCINNMEQRVVEDNDGNNNNDNNNQEQQQQITAYQNKLYTKEYQALLTSYQEYCTEMMTLLIALTTAIKPVNNKNNNNNNNKNNNTTTEASLAFEEGVDVTIDDINPDEELLTISNLTNTTTPIDISTMHLQAYTHDLLQQHHKYFTTALNNQQISRRQLRHAHGMGGVDYTQNIIHNNSIHKNNNNNRSNNDNNNNTSASSGILDHHLLTTIISPPSDIITTTNANNMSNTPTSTTLCAQNNTSSLLTNVHVVLQQSIANITNPIITNNNNDIQDHYSTQQYQQHQQQRIELSHQAKIDCLSQQLVAKEEQLQYKEQYILQQQYIHIQQLLIKEQQLVEKERQLVEKEQQLQMLLNKFVSSDKQ